ncbi:MAG: hypothetical protein FWD52_05390 [Candidatus Bathyarchaeota archaeon]|nr:hypothetical protein [Candidatus Termiticorpusculum sp.]
MQSTIRKLVSISIVTIMIVNIILTCVVQATHVLEPAEGAISISSDYPHYVGPKGGRFIAPIDPLTDAIIKAEGYIEISDRAGLEAIKNNLNGKYYLSDDICLSGVEWIPIGDDTAPFRGTFDGRGYVIYNLAIMDDYQYAGLFGYVENAMVKNVGLVGVTISISISSCVGGICGVASDSTVSNCYSAGKISTSYPSISSYSDYSYVGGICGVASDSTVSYCYNTGNISVSSTTSSSPCVGGICGYMSDGTMISYCYNTGNISVSCGSSFS